MQQRTEVAMGTFLRGFQMHVGLSRFRCSNAGNQQRVSHRVPPRCLLTASAGEGRSGIHCNFVVIITSSLRRKGWHGSTVKTSSGAEQRRCAAIASGHSSSSSLSMGAASEDAPSGAGAAQWRQTLASRKSRQGQQRDSNSTIEGCTGRSSYRDPSAIL